MGIPEDLTCLLRNLYAGQEATVTTVHGTMDWLKIVKRVCQGCIFSPSLFKFYAEYIMWNTGLNEPQARIKIARRNINNFRYADNTTLTTESEEKLKSLLMKINGENEKFGLKLNIKKKKKLRCQIKMASGPIISRLIDGKKHGNSDRHFLEFQNHCRWWLQPWNWKLLDTWKKSYNKPRQQKCRDITLLTKVHWQRKIIFPVVM